MASVSNFPEHTLCTVCREPFKDPRTLPCLHSFCQACLQKKIQNEASKEFLLCPLCQRPVPTPQEGMAGLSPNPHLAYEVEVATILSNIATNNTILCNFCSSDCNDPASAFCCACRKFLCKAGHECHRRVSQLLSHDVIGLDKESSRLIPSMVKPWQHHCSQPNHSKEELRFYCVSCDCLICRDCVLVAHKDHQFVELSTYADGNRADVKEAVRSAQDAVRKLEEAVAFNEDMMKKMGTSRENAGAIIRQAFDALQKTLAVRRQTLLSELEALFNGKMDPLMTQNEQCHRTLKDIKHQTSVANRTLQTHTDHEMVSIGRLLLGTLRNTIATADALSVTVNQHSDVTVAMEADRYVDELSVFGQIADIYPSSKKSTWTPDTVPRLNAPFIVKIQTRAANGDDYPFGGLKVKGELKSKLTDRPAVWGEACDHRDGTYTLSLVPQATGPHVMSVTIGDQHVQNSPCDVSIKPKHEYHNLVRAEIFAKIDNPYSLAVHNSGDLFVGNGIHCISVFDHTGNLKTTIGGSGDERFQYPYGISIKGDVLYVADYGNHCVQKLTIGGQLIRKYGQKGAGPGALNGPMAVVPGHGNQLIVSERHNNRVQVLSEEDGASLAIIDGKACGFQAPWGLALDPKDCLHVTASATNHVKVFDSDFRSVRSYGSVKGPIGISIDEEGYSLVTEGSVGCLSIYDPQGTKVGSVGNLRRPWGVARGKGAVYVANSGANNVLKYSFQGQGEEKK